MSSETKKHFARAFEAQYPDWQEGDRALFQIAMLADDIDCIRAQIRDAAERASRDLANLARDVSEGRCYASNPVSGGSFSDLPMLVAKAAATKEAFWRFIDATQDPLAAKALRVRIQESYGRLGAA